MLRAFAAIAIVMFASTAIATTATAAPKTTHEFAAKKKRQAVRRAEPTITCNRFGCSDHRRKHTKAHVRVVRHARGHYTRAARLGGRPKGCPGPWCGCWYSLHKFGRIIPRLNLARNWAKEGTPAHGPGVGVTVVWPHHVGEIVGRGKRGWIVLSGNDGHAVRERERSLRGAIAFRRMPGRYAAN